MKSKILTILLVILQTLVLATPAFSQSHTIADSILKASTMRMYDNPQRAIAIGDSLYHSKGLSIEDRVNALILISDGYSSIRNYQSALKYFLKADELSQEIDNNYFRIKILSKTAIKYQQVAIFDKAIEYLDKSDQLIKNYTPKDSVMKFYGTNLILRGIILKDELSCGIAIEYFDKGIKIHEKINHISVFAHISIAYYNKGNCYILNSEYAQAEKSFNESLRYAQKGDAISLKAFAEKGLAEVHTLKGNYNDAITLLNEALLLSERVGDVVLQKGIYSSLAQNYLAKNNLKEYEKYNTLFLKKQLRLKESERNSISDSLKESEQAAVTQMKALDKQYVLINLLIFIVAIIINLLLFRYYKKAVKLLVISNSRLKKLKN